MKRQISSSGCYESPVPSELAKNLGAGAQGEVGQKCGSSQRA